jgi:predicted permease
LGIGANATLFSVVDALWLQAVPYRAASRLVLVFSRTQNSERQLITSTDFAHFVENASLAFEAFGAFSSNRSARFDVDQSTILVGSRFVEPSFFAAASESPIFGQLFAPGRVDAVGPEPLVVTESFWRARFGLERDSTRHRLKINGRDAVILGVVSDKVKSIQNSDVFQLLVPLSAGGSQSNWTNVTILARLRPGVSVRQAEAVLELTNPKTEPRRRTATIVPLRDYLVGASVKRILFALLAATSIILLVACANVSTMTIAAIARRQQEFAIRAALGAGRRQLLRQVLIESMCLSIVSVGAALLIAATLKGTVIALMPPVPRAHPVVIDWRVATVSAVIGLMVSAAISVVPVLTISQIHPASALTNSRPSFQGIGGVRNRHFLAILLGGQIAMCMIALVISGLVLNSLRMLIRVDPGFDVRNVTTIEVTALNGAALIGASATALEEEALLTLRRFPGVVAAGSTDQLPLTGAHATYSVQVEGRRRFDDDRTVVYRRISPGYLEAMGIRVKRGRSFTAQDRRGSADVLIINEEMARQFFPGEDPIFKQLSLGGQPLAKVVGIVTDVHAFGLDQEPAAEVYRCRLQDPNGDAMLVVKTAAAPGALIVALRGTVNPLLTSIRARNVRSLDDWVQRSFVEPRFRSILFSALGLTTFLLTIVGVGGLTSRTVASRKREIGIRLAMGASYPRVRREVVADIALPLVCGTTVGIIATFWLSKLVEQFLFGVHRNDPATIVAALVTVVGASLLIAYISTTRVTLIDPAGTLRSE